MRKFEDMVKEIVKLCHKFNIKYVIVGGVSVSIWGNIRTTRDIDIIFFFRNSDVRKLTTELRKRDFSVREADIREALKEKSHFTIFDNQSVYMVDGKGVYNSNDLETIKNRKRVRLDRVTLYVNSPEDLIINKLIFGSEQDIKDAESVYIRQLKKLDMKYLEKKCKRLNVHKEFIKMRRKIEKCLKNLV